MLTQAEKDRRVADWLERREQSFDISGDPAGLGYPDRAIFGLTDALNAIDGVCTAQSCSGHPRTPEREWEASGQVWLRLSQEMFDAFVMSQDGARSVGEQLARYPLVEQVAVLWGRERDGHVIEVTFAGLNHSARALAGSSLLIEGCFAALVPR